MISNNRPSLEDTIVHERIRQARWGFNVAVSFTVVSAGLTVVGFCLLIARQNFQGAFTAAGGLTSTAVGNRCLQLARDANDRLDKLGDDADDDEVGQG